ncbi:MAG: IS200/IS605 family transposase [Candidatus Babeliales bacterium]
MCTNCDFEKQVLCRLKYHLMLGPVAQSRVLQGPLADKIKQLIQDCAQENQWELEDVEFHDNLVHVVVELPHTISLDAAVKTIKAFTNKGLKAAFPAYEEFSQSTGFWSEGFFAQTLDGFTSEEDFLNFMSGADGSEDEESDQE